MALALLAAVTSALPATALAAKSAKAAANPVASDLGDFVGRLRGFLPQTHFEWVDLGRTLLLHVDYWILIAVAYAFARRLTQLAADRKLRRVKAAMAYARHRDATYTSVETGMLEWINHLLRHEWRAVISAAVDEQARAAMERVMRDASRMSGGLVRRAVVEEATFGVVPPDLKLYVSRYNPGEDYLQFEFDFRWDTVSSHIVIKADVSAPSGGHSNALGGIPSALLSTFARAVPSVRVPIHVTDLSFAGRLLLGVRLSARAPGVSGLDVSFDGKPDVSVSVKPAGVPVNDIPGVRAFVEQKIGEVFAASYVEPKRYYHDVESLFLSKNLKGIPGSIDASAIGPNGALVVDVRNAERLPATSATTKAACPYLEVTYGGVTKRTPTRLNTTDPDWSTRLVFPLVSSEERFVGSRRRMSPLRVRVMDWSPLGEPRCIGHAKQMVDLGRLRASAEKAAAARPGDARDAAGGALGLARHALPLRGTRGGVLHLSIGAVDAPTLVSGTDADARPSGGETAWGETHSRPRDRGGAAAAASPSRLDVGDSETRGAPDSGAYEYDEVFEDGVDVSYEDDFEVGEVSPGRDESPPTPDATERAAEPAPEPSLVAPPTTRGGAGSDGGAAAAAHLMRLAKVQKARREENEAHQRSVSRLTTSLRDANESYALEKERRGLELRRALVEGAAFTVHTKRKPGFEPGTYRLWYVASKQHIVWAKGTKPGAKPKLHQFVPASLVKECVPGVDAFTLGADGDPARCFSIALWKPDAVENNLSNGLLGSGAAGLGLVTIDLELPEGGNGRGAREWCDAIAAVAEENGGGRLDLDEEEEEEEEVCEKNVSSTAIAANDRGGPDDRATSVARGDAERGAAAPAFPPAGAESYGDQSDAAPLRRRVSLPKSVSVGVDDDASEDVGGEMLTIPIPPDSVEDDRGGKEKTQIS